jgi:hypothetical protein
MNNLITFSLAYFDVKNLRAYYMCTPVKGLLFSLFSSVFLSFQVFSWVFGCFLVLFHFLSSFFMFRQELIQEITLKNATQQLSACS